MYIQKGVVQKEGAQVQVKSSRNHVIWKEKVVNVSKENNTCVLGSMSH